MQEPHDPENPYAAPLPGDRGAVVNHPPSCAGCGYLLAGIDITGACPECNTPILGSCFHCGYNLEGSDPHGSCPECGVPAIESVGLGPFNLVSTGSLRAIHSGFRLSLGSILVYLVAVVIGAIGGGIMGASVSPGSGLPPWYHAFLITTSAISNAAVLGFYRGMWKISTHPGGISRHADRPDRRRLLRVMCVIGAVCVVMSFAFSFVPPQSPQNFSMRPVDIAALLVSLVCLGVMLLFWIALMRYVRWFASIARNKRMLGRAKHLIWSGPLMVVVGWVVLLIGPIVFVILFYRMLDSLRRDIRAILRSRDPAL